MRILVALVMVSVSVSALAVDVAQKSPVEFSIEPFLNLNIGRGGADYSVNVTGAFSDAGTFGCNFSITSNANGAVVSSGDTAFQSWNSAQAKPYIVQAVVVTPSISVGNILVIGNLSVRFTHGLVVGQSALMTLQFREANSVFGIVNEQVFLPVNIVNTKPVLSVSASPKMTTVGSAVLLPSVASDLDGQVVSVTYNYGDGTGGIDPSHTYASAGVYTVTAFAFDGFDSVTAQTTVTVVGQENIPTARIQTSDIVAFVNIPFTVDGTTSTDQENQPLAFAWNFGDGTPVGSGAVLSHIFATEGSCTISLTVTDTEGFTSTTTLGIEVLAESAAATFDSEIRVTSTYFPQKQNRDQLQVFARVNIGDTKLDAGSALALEYAGKRYTATLNARKKAVGWTIKQGLRRQTPGTAEVTFKIRNTAIASLLAGLGAENNAEINVPFRLELGPKTIQINVPTLFDVSATRGKGAGELD